jgi:hypothetical protein
MGSRGQDYQSSLGQISGSVRPTLASNGPCHFIIPSNDTNSIVPRANTSVLRVHYRGNRQSSSGSMAVAIYAGNSAHHPGITKSRSATRNAIEHPAFPVRGTSIRTATIHLPSWPRVYSTNSRESSWCVPEYPLRPSRRLVPSRL